MAKRERGLTEVVIDQPIPLPSANKVILELIQYADKEYDEYSDLPVVEMMEHFKGAK